MPFPKAHNNNKQHKRPNRNPPTQANPMHMLKRFPKYLRNDPGWEWRMCPQIKNLLLCSSLLGSQLFANHLCNEVLPPLHRNPTAQSVKHAEDNSNWISVRGVRMALPQLLPHLENYTNMRIMNTSQNQTTAIRNRSSSKENT
jgi:hypothetical protein